MKFRGRHGLAGTPEGWGVWGAPGAPHERSQMGQYDRHVFVCTSGDTCPTQADVERYVKVLRDSARAAGKQTDVRINKSGCFNQCGHGPMIVVYPENVWYAGVKESDLEEIVTSHIVGGRPVERLRDRKSTRLNSSHLVISYAV